MGRPPSRARRGEGKVYKRGRLWAVRWTENGQRHYSGGYLNEADANRVLAILSLNLRAGRPGLEMLRPPNAEQLPTFGSFVDEWIADRKAKGRRSADDDLCRWNRYLAPLFADRRLDEKVDTGFLDRMITDLRNPPVGSLDPWGQPRKPLSPATAQRVVHLLSAFYVWLGKHHGVTTNPVRALKGDGDIRDLLRSTHDPKRVPFLKRKEDVAVVFRALPRSVNIVYALSALAGLRPGEAVALEWDAVDLDAGIILVRRQLRNGQLGVPKSGKAREVPIVPSLSAVLKAWRKKNPKAELVAPSLRKSNTGKTKFLNWRTIQNAMKKALKECGLRRMTFYQAGRHTFASQWVISGNSIYRLKEIMGHSSVQVTERYAHLTNQLTDAELARGGHQARELVVPTESEAVRDKQMDLEAADRRRRFRMDTVERALQVLRCAKIVPFTQQHREQLENGRHTSTGPALRELSVNFFRKWGGKLAATFNERRAKLKKEAERRATRAYLAGVGGDLEFTAGLRYRLRNPELSPPKAPEGADPRWPSGAGEASESRRGHLRAQGRPAVELTDAINAEHPDWAFGQIVAEARKRLRTREPPTRGSGEPPTPTRGAGGP